MDWTTLIVGALIGALIATPFGIFGNIVTPWVKSYFEKRSLSTKERKLYILLKRYNYIKALRAVPIIVNLVMFRMLAWGLTSLIVLVAIIGFLLLNAVLQPVSYPSIYLFMGFLPILIFTWFGLYTMGKLTETLDDVEDFDKYREKVKAKLIKLGGNPEDLDKEETAGG